MFEENIVLQGCLYFCNDDIEKMPGEFARKYKGLKNL